MFRADVARLNDVASAIGRIFICRKTSKRLLLVIQKRAESVISIEMVRFNAIYLALMTLFMAKLSQMSSRSSIKAKEPKSNTLSFDASIAISINVCASSHNFVGWFVVAFFISLSAFHFIVKSFNGSAWGIFLGGITIGWVSTWCE